MQNTKRFRTNGTVNSQVSVIIEDGIVRFIDEHRTTPNDLANMLYSFQDVPLTRSVWQSKNSADDTVSVAMLINFEFGNASLTKESKDRLSIIGKMLSLDITADKKLVIEGHTDIAGFDAFNERLSFARAESVKRHLTFQHGISQDRLQITGKGEKHLIDPENPSAAVNRRVQFKAS